MFLSWSYLGQSWFWRKAVYQWCGGKYKGLCKWNVVTFHTTDPTPSPSLLETLHRCIVDHHTLPVVRSLCPSRQFLYWPESSGTLLYAKTPLPIFGISLVNRLCSTHVYLPSISGYSHARSRYHMFNLPCHMFVLLFHMLLFIIPHAISKSSTYLLLFVTYHVSSLQYISFKYLSCISPVLNIKSSSPLLSHFTSEV